MGDIAEIIGRLERLEEPDRECDAAIAKICAPTDDPKSEAFLNGRDYPDLYTASIDAALTLVPDGYKWKLGYSRNVPCVADVVDYRIGGKGGRYDGECDSNHAIALCIAALKAREKQ